MLIYNSSSNSPFGGTGSYKSASNRKRSGIRKKAVKHNTTQQHKPSRKVKKVNEKKPKKHKKRKSLNAKNVKFLKKLGFRVKKH